MVKVVKAVKAVKAVKVMKVMKMVKAVKVVRLAGGGEGRELVKAVKTVKVKRIKLAGMKPAGMMVVAGRWQRKRSRNYFLRYCNPLTGNCSVLYHYCCSLL